MRRIILVAALLAAGLQSARAQELQEIVVTASRTESGSIPGTSLRRPGDYILLSVGISNDARDQATRKSEVYDTLRAMLAAASKDKSIQLSIIGDNSLVLPLRLDSATISLVNGKRPDTTETTISVKTQIPPTIVNSSALVAKLRDFVRGIKPVGRTLIDGDGDFEISVVNPMQYRGQVIALFAEDIKTVTAALGPDYKVIARGIDRPIRWIRSGMLEVELFVPYSYDVLPATVSSYLTTQE